MRSFFAKTIFIFTASAFVLATSATAEEKKPRKKRVATQTTQLAGKYRGTNLFPAGPVYNGPDYFGDDPDPFIRSQIWRDLTVRYGGD